MEKREGWRKGKNGGGGVGWGAEGAGERATASEQVRLPSARVKQRVVSDGGLCSAWML